MKNKTKKSNKKKKSNIRLKRNENGRFDRHADNTCFDSPEAHLYFAITGDVCGF